jgi:hypothetical protein
LFLLPWNHFIWEHFSMHFFGDILQHHHRTLISKCTKFLQIFNIFFSRFNFYVFWEIYIKWVYLYLHGKYYIVGCHIYYSSYQWNLVHSNLLHKYISLISGLLEYIFSINMFYLESSINNDFQDLNGLQHTHIKCWKCNKHIHDCVHANNNEHWLFFKVLMQHEGYLLCIYWFPSMEFEMKNKQCISPPPPHPFFLSKMGNNLWQNVFWKKSNVVIFLQST